MPEEIITRIDEDFAPGEAQDLTKAIIPRVAPSEAIPNPMLNGKNIEQVLRVDQEAALEKSGVDLTKTDEFKSARGKLHEFLGFDDARIAALRAKGEMGPGESAKRNISSLMGDAFTFFKLLSRSDSPQGMRVVDSAKIIRAFTGEEDPDEDGKPEFLKSPTLRLGRVFNATKRIQSDNYKAGEEDLRDRDMDSVIDYMVEIEEERIRGTTIGGEISAGLLALPEFILSFIATGGLSALAKQAVKRGLKGFIKAEVKGGIKGFAAKAALRTLETGAAGFARTIGSPHLVGKNFLQRQVGSNFEMTNKGIRLLKEANEKPVTSLLKAFGDTVIEMASEETGQFISAGLSKLGGAVIPKVFKETMQKMFTKLNPLKKAGDLWAPNVYDGFLAEMGEEQLGDLMRAMTGIEDFGTGDEATMVDRMLASLHGGRQLAVNAGIIAPLSLISGFSNIKKPGSGKFVKDAKETAAGDKNKVPSDQTLGELIQKQADRKAEEAEAKKKSLGLDEEAKAEPTEKKPEAKPTAEVKAEPKKTEAKAPAKKAEPKEAKEAVDKQKKLIKEGRVDELNKVADSVEKELVREEKGRRELVAEGKSTNHVDKRMDSLRNSLDTIEQETAEIQETDAPIKPGAKIRTTPSRVVAAVRQKVSEATTLTKAEAKKAQTELLGALNRSRLADIDKTKFTKTIISLQTIKDFQKKLPAIEARIRSLEEKSAKRRLVTTIKKGLKKARVKKVGGKPKGKLTPPIQKVLTKFEEAIGLDSERAFNKILANQKKLDDPSISPEQVVELRLENGILSSMSDLSSRTSEQLGAINARIRALIATGRDAAEVKLQKEALRKGLLIKDSLRVIGPVDPTQTKKGLFTKIRQRLTTFGRSISGWADIMDILSIGDSSSKAFQSALSKHADVIPTEQQEKKLAFDSNQNYVNVGKEAFNLKTDRQFNRQIDRDSKKMDFGIFPDASEVDVRIEMTKAEIRDLWMKMRDVPIREVIEAAEGGYAIGEVKVRGFTKDMQDAVFAELTVEDKNFSQAEFKIYRDLHPKVNKQFSKDRNVDLPFNQFYSPVRRKLGQQRVTDTFLDEQGFRRSIDPKFVKSRVKNFEIIQAQSDVVTMQSHLSEMAHYLAWADKLKDLNAIFGNSDVRDAINNKFGKPTMSLIDGFIEDFTNKGFRRSAQVEGIINRLRINFTVSALALKPALFLKQQASIFAYAEFVSAKEFTAGMVDFWKNPIANWRILNEASPLFRTRSSNMERDIKDAADSVEASKFKKIQSAKNMLLMFTKWGDKTAIAVGGWSVYKATLDKTGSKAAAIKAFEAATAVTQQSSDTSQLSDWQRGGAFAKAFTMFTTSQNQYLRKEIGAIRNLLADPKAFIKGEGRISRKDFAKKIAIYHFVLPMFFQWISDFGTWDEDEQKRAATLGSLNGIFIIGDVLDAGIRLFLNEFADTDLPTFLEGRGESPIFQIKDGVLDFLSTMTEDDISAEDIFGAILDLAEDTVGPATGVPVKRILDSYEGIEDIIDDDEIASGSLKLLGFSPYTVDKKLGKKKNGFDFDF